ncbi:MAG: response regulator [Desulfobacterales bacterium]|nr:response regulator [Desulfobacterales bacterium]
MTDSTKPNILIVDDKPQNLISLEAILENPDVNIIKADSGNAALSKMLDHDFALVLLDVQMPDMDGFETAELIRGNKRNRHIPIIFVTAISKEKKHIFKGYQSGAVDYIFKPLDPDILKNKVGIFLDLFRQRKMIENRNIQLQKANKTILAQQKSLIEEERLKVMLQMAGAAAHELNQPLMILLANLEMLEFVKNDPQKIFELIPKIQAAGEKISGTVKKIQNVSYDMTTDHDSKTKIIRLDQKINILSIEDSDPSYELFKVCFSKRPSIRLSRAKTIQEAFSRLSRSDFHLILLDYDLPDGTGLDFLNTMKSKNIELPVIAVTGLEDAKIASDLIKAGAFDYLSKKDISKQALLKVVDASLKKFGLRKEMGQAIKKMAEISTKDQLTGLYNRRYMDGALKMELERARRYDTDLCCLMLDLDFFKHVNDTYGHLCGDYVLQEFARDLERTKRQSDYLFRYGGEEFAVLTPQTDLQGGPEIRGKDQAAL